jgi:superfamily II DNA or RNA helicase
MELSWKGPKIAKYGNKYLGFYDLRITSTFIAPKEFEELHQKLRYNEFRKIVESKGGMVYQFVYPVTNEEYNEYLKGKNELKMTGYKILDYARSRQAAFAYSNVQLKSRRDREEKWKEWYQEYQNWCNNLQKEKSWLATEMNNMNLVHEKKLLKFQTEHVKSLIASIKKYHRVLDASDTGTGKTYSALCVAKELNLIPIIVCPKSVVPHWRAAVGHFDITEFYVSNYEQYRNGKTPYVVKLGNNTSTNNTSANNNTKIVGSHDELPKLKYEWLLDKDKHMLIFDECHKVKRLTTLNYNIYWWARELKDINILSLSATVADKIENAYSICYMLGLVSNMKDFRTKYMSDMDTQVFGDFGYEVTNDGAYRFNEKYRLVLDNLRGCDLNLRRLHEDMFPLRGRRMVIEEMGDAFPDNFIDAQTFDMGTRTDEIREIYDNMEKMVLQFKLKVLCNRETTRRNLEDIAEFRALEEKESTKLATLKKECIKDREQMRKIRDDLITMGIPVDESDLGIKEDKEKQEILLVTLLRARQKVEMLKTETLYELTEKFLEEGKSVVIFVNFKATLHHLKNLFETNYKDIKIGLIHGDQTTEERSIAIDGFQSNERRLLITTIQSGGVGISLHDLHGGHPRVSLISPSWSAQDLVQALGRIARAGAKTKCQQYLIFCARTIEDRICLAIKGKLETIKTINDGDLDGILNLSMS